MSAVLLVAALIQAPAQSPARAISDPGIIAAGQRITPAGVQSVFAGKVGGVRFGTSSQDIIVAVPGSIQHVAWRDNRVISRAHVDGRPGIYALAIDPVTHRVLSSSVGRLVTTGPNARRNPAVAQLQIFDGNASGDSVAASANSGALGDYMVGAPAVALKSGPPPDGKRLAVLPLPANDSLAVIDADAGTLIRKIALGVEPIAAVISADSRVAYVSVLGGPKPKPGQRSAMQTDEPRAEAVRIDARGIAEPGSVARVDLATGAVTDITVGRHPTALAWDESGAKLYVAAGNSDSITIVDSRRNAVTGSIAIAPFRERRIGLAPTALALSPDRATLYVTLGGVNALGVYDLRPTPHLKGLVPTSWYPSSVDVSPDGKYIAVGSLFGPGAGTGTLHQKTSRYVFATRGAVNVIPAPTDAELVAYTTAVSENDKLALASSAGPPVNRTVAAARVVPERPGDSSLVHHVVFIVRENRTYDQVLGDHEMGSHDSSLVMYGRGVTPNAHALAREFVTLDHFFVNGGNSADGHQWLTQANETEYPMWPLYFGRSYPSEGIDALAYSSGGFLWEAAQAKNLSVAVFGEYAPSVVNSKDSVRRAMFAQYNEHPNDFALHREMLKARYNTKSDIPSLDRALVREYPGWTQEVPDVVKAGDILAHLGDWESAKKMPDLTMIILPNDHTEGTNAGWCIPRACVADNDYALGKIVEGLSKSSFWKDMAIFVVEDDAQDGVDHIDGHRTVALAISPFTKRGTVDSTMYTQPSMVKTIELMLGLSSMSIFDLVATDMHASFIDPGEKAIFTTYTAIAPQISLLAENPKPATIQGRFSRERRSAALASSRMMLDSPDEAPAEQLNRILWHDARGWDKAYPTVRHAMVFPLAVDVSDDDRREKGPVRKK
jgi:DNA-binding beta-propeller fold protein YncE